MKGDILPGIYKLPPVARVRCKAMKWFLMLLALTAPLHAKAPSLEIRAMVESIKVEKGAVEIAFSGTLSHVSGNGPGEDHWGFSARVKGTKLIVSNSRNVFFFTQDANGRPVTHNFQQESELGTKIYGNPGRPIVIHAYSPAVHFDRSIERISAESVTLSILTDTMSGTATAEPNPVKRPDAAIPKPD